MRLLRQLLGRTPSSPSGRVRNYLANRCLGAQWMVIHENVINPGGAVPWHAHAIEQVIVVLDGFGECRTSVGGEAYHAGDVIIVSAHEPHALHNTSDTALRQLCIFGGEPNTLFLEGEHSDMVVEVFNTPKGT